MKQSYVNGLVVGAVIIFLVGLHWGLGPTKSHLHKEMRAITTAAGPVQVFSSGENGTSSVAKSSMTPSFAAHGPLENAVAAVSASGSTKPRPVSQIGRQAVDYPGSFAAASVQVGNLNFNLTPNQLGNFQQVKVGPKQKVQVQVSYPQGSEGEQVAVTVEDGGHLNEKQMSEVTSLNSEHNVNFQFQTTDQPGIYRVALRSGAAGDVPANAEAA